MGKKENEDKKRQKWSNLIFFFKNDLFEHIYYKKNKKSAHSIFDVTSLFLVVHIRFH